MSLNDSFAPVLQQQAAHFNKNIDEHDKISRVSSSQAAVVHYVIRMFVICLVFQLLQPLARLLFFCAPTIPSQHVIVTLAMRFRMLWAVFECFTVLVPGKR
jgi:hypothetical protein